MEVIVATVALAAALFLVRHFLVRAYATGRVSAPGAALGIAAVWASIPFVGVLIGIWPFNVVTVALAIGMLVIFSVLFDRMLRSFRPSR